jgi:hypothetical protein
VPCRNDGALASWRWHSVDKDNAQASYNKRTSPSPPASPPDSLCLNQRLEALHSPSRPDSLTPFVGYNCCPCCSNAFALLVVPVAPVRIYSPIPHPSTRIPPHIIATFPQQHEAIHGKFSPVRSYPLPPLPRSYHLPHSCRHFTSHTQSDRHPRPRPRPPRPCLFPTLSNGTCLSGH